MGLADRLPFAFENAAEIAPNVGGVAGLTAPAMQAAKPGFFDRGGLAAKLAGILGDGLTGRPLYAQSVMQDRAQQSAFDRGEQQYQRQRADGMADWQAKQDYEASNPKPYRWEANDGSLMEMDAKTGVPRVVYKDPTPKMQWVPDGYGGGQFVAVTPQAPTQRPAIGQRHPGFQGGAAPQGAGGFQPPRIGG